MKTLIKNGTLITLGEKNRILENHSLLIENSKIKKIAPAAEIKEVTDRTIEAHGKVVMPGFINTHMHFYSTFARGLPTIKPSANFREVLENLWWKLDKKLTHEDTYLSALVILIEAIRKGTTTLLDHHASPIAQRGSLREIARAVKETGLRASLCYEVSDRDGREIARAGIEENINFIRQTEQQQDPQLRALFGLHASFTLSDETIQKAVDFSKNAGVGFHVHTAEALSDQEHCMETYRESVVERFNRLGVLGSKTICAHGVHLNENEMDLLAQTGTKLVHNPQSNMNNAVGIAPVLRMLEKGICVGLGTDAMTVNMLEELRASIWAQRLGEKNPSCGFSEMCATLIQNNAIIADQYWNLGLGELKEGSAADLVLMDYCPPTPMNDGNFLGHLCFGLAESQVDTTIVAGSILMQNKILKLNIDEDAVYARSRESAKKLWERL